MPLYGSSDGGWGGGVTGAVVFAMLGRRYPIPALLDWLKVQWKNSHTRRSIGRGAILGSLGFPVPQHEQKVTLWACIAFGSIMGGFLGWGLSRERPRDCPQCGSHMGKGRQRDGADGGPVLYFCPPCQREYQAEDLMREEAYEEQ